MITPPLFGKPLVASICGTFLKPEMQSVYRQIVGLQRHRTIVLTERHMHAEQFPFDPVIVMQKPPPEVRLKARKKRQRGNFIRRFYYKHLLKQWPPPERPRPVTVPPLPAPVFHDAYDLVEILQQQRVALAHVYYGHKAVKYLPMLRRWAGPLVVSFHGLDVTDEAYKPGDPATLAEVFAHARLILARSESLLERLAALGCPSEKLRLNRTAVPVSSHPSTVRRPPVDGRWIFLQACRLISKKGLLTTLGAMRRIVDAWPEAQLIVAGDGPLAGALRAAVDELGLGQSVWLPGWCSQEELRGLYQRAHVFLHPSEMTAAGDREGVPNSLLEAMATGLPGVATWHGGIPEAVINGEDGLLVPEKSPELLAGAVLRLTRESGLLERLSIRAVRNVDEKFGEKRQIENLEECYQTALSKS